MEIQEKAQHEAQEEAQVELEQKSKKKAKVSSKDFSKDSLSLQGESAPVEPGEGKSVSIKVTFDGEVAKRIIRCELELRDRLSKPDLGKMIGAEILTWTEEKWSEIVEENTDIEYFFSQIRKYPNKTKSIQLLKSISEKLCNGVSEEVLSPLASL